MKMTGAVLAGGQSSRMGRDKTLVEIDGTPFVLIVAKVLSVVCERVMIIGNQPDRFQSFGFQVFEDIFQNSGPLGGIHSALVHAKGANVFIAACDLPLISNEAARAIAQRRSSDGEIFIAKCGEMVQPLFGIYSAACTAGLEEFLKQGNRKVRDFLSLSKTKVIDLPELSMILPNILTNVNTPEEYEKLIKQETPAQAGSDFGG